MTPQRAAAPHLVQLGLVGLEVIGDAGLDLLGLPPQHLPELGALLALVEQCDLCFALALILVDLLSEEPVGALREVGSPPPWVPSPGCQPLPGLGGAAQRGLAAPPHKKLQAVVQEEDKAGEHGDRAGEEGSRMHHCPPHTGVFVEQAGPLHRV